MARNFELDSDQIDYMRTVLGLDRVLVPLIPEEDMSRAVPKPTPTTTKATGQLESARMIALFPLNPSDFPLAGEAESLVEKMIRAMKVDPLEVFNFEWSTVSAPSELGPELEAIRTQAGARPIVVFGGGAAASALGLSLVNGQWTSWEDARLMPTFSPRELIESPDRKRVAWVHLQAVMKEL